MTLLLLPERVPTMRPPYITVHPATLMTGDLILDGRLNTWAVLARLKDRPTQRNPHGETVGCLRHCYVMVRTNGPQRGEKAVLELPTIVNVKVKGGVRYLYACRRPHKDMHRIDYKLYRRYWRELEAVA